MPSFTLKCCSILCSRVTHCEPLLRLLGNQRRVANQKEASLLFFYGFQIFCGPFIHSGIFMATVLNHCTCLHQTPLVIMLVKILSSSAATCWRPLVFLLNTGHSQEEYKFLIYSLIATQFQQHKNHHTCGRRCVGLSARSSQHRNFTHKLLFLHPPFCLHVHLYINIHPYIQTQNVVTFTRNLVPSLFFLLWM